MMIPIYPELEAALKQAAEKEGISPEGMALRTLRERFLGPLPELPPPRDGWERRLREAATDCGVWLSNDDLSSEGLYDQWHTWSIRASWDGWQMSPTPCFRLPIVR